MDVFDPAGALDTNKFIEYITKQFPGELKTMLAARDELAKRQGALDAVAKAQVDREAAAAELAKAKANAAAVMADADARDALSKTKSAELDQEKADFAKYMAGKVAEIEAREKASMAAEKQANARAAALDAGEAAVKQREEKVREAEAALDARVKAFQDKVAALNV